MLDKSTAYVLAEGMYFLEKCSPLNFRREGGFIPDREDDAPH